VMLGMPLCGWEVVLSTDGRVVRPHRNRDVRQRSHPVAITCPTLIAGISGGLFRWFDAVSRLFEV